MSLKKLSLILISMAIYHSGSFGQELKQVYDGVQCSAKVLIGPDEKLISCKTYQRIFKKDGEALCKSFQVYSHGNDKYSTFGFSSFLTSPISDETSRDVCKDGELHRFFYGSDYYSYMSSREIAYRNVRQTAMGYPLCEYNTKYSNKNDRCVGNLTTLSDFSNTCAKFDAKLVKSSADYPVDSNKLPEYLKCGGYQEREAQHVAQNIFNGGFNPFVICKSLTGKPATSFNEAVWTFNNVLQYCPYYNNNIRKDIFKTAFCEEGQKHLLMGYWDDKWIFNNVGDRDNISRNKSYEAYCPRIKYALPSR